ncbi:hypothetical protein BH11PSE7_BH11PSE7_00090 [soil metagenome]
MSKKKSATTTVDGSGFDSLTLALEDWFGTALADLPEAIGDRVKREFNPMPWDGISAEGRRSVALQIDYQTDPSTEPERQFWWDFHIRKDEVKAQIARWESAATSTTEDLALKETRVADLHQQLARMEAQERQSRWTYDPTLPQSTARANEPATSGSALDYLAYPKALGALRKKLGATPEELAAWVWDGPKDGGIAAYVNANELHPPPRFHYGLGNSNGIGDDFDYLSPLMACWFKKDDLAQFQPKNRYLTGKALIERWTKHAGLQPVAFIKAKVAELRLMEIHPLYGGTQATFPEEQAFPPLLIGLFVLAHVEQIEAEDLAELDEMQNRPTRLPALDAPPETAVGSQAWRKQNAKNAADALHDQPGGSRDKQRRIQEIWASGKYSSRTLCAEQECAALDMSYDAARRALTNTPAPSRC